MRLTVLIISGDGPSVGLYESVGFRHRLVTGEQKTQKVDMLPAVYFFGAATAKIMLVAFLLFTAS